MAEAEALLEQAKALIEELADEVESYVENEYEHSKHHPALQHRYERDMELPRRARAFVKEVRDG